MGRASQAYDRARQLLEEAQALRAQARIVIQAVADRRRGRVTGQLSRARQDLPQRSEYARLLARLDTMPVIEQAKGIVMAQSRCTPDEAFDLLRRASQRSSVPVRDLAAKIVAGTIGVPPQPR